jgi:hypothetical protein
MIINFENVIEESKRNTNLEEDIKQHEFATFMHRCRSTYLEFCSKYNGKGVETFCPPVFTENRNLLRMATNNTYQFVASKFKYSEGASISIPQINKAFKVYLKDRFDMKRAPKTMSTFKILRLLMRDTFTKSE